MSIKVSVIIPTYKRSEFLIKSIESVLNQTYSNVEIVVIDDNEVGSSYRNKTEKKMDKYNTNEKVKYFQNEKNLGGALARNVGISKAKGEYITFLDDDDVYLPKKIDLQLNFMLENDMEISFTDVRFHNDNNILIDYREHPYLKDLSKNELLRNHIMHHLTPTSTYMFKKTTLVNIGCFDDVKMGQEFMLMLKAIENNSRIGYLATAQVIQYIHDGERISLGENKLKKEKELYNFKKKYFVFLSHKEVKYVKFRHFAVMTVVGVRSRKPVTFFLYAIRVFTTSPTNCILELVKHIRKINKHKHYL